MYFWTVFRDWIVVNQDFLAVGVIVISILTGALVEFSKKAWKPLEEKYRDDEIKIAKLKVIKGWVSQIIGAVLVLAFLACMNKSTIGILGGIALFPLWFALDFFLQFLVSCHGLKVIKKYIENQRNKPRKERKEVVKAYRDPATGELIEL